MHTNGGMSHSHLSSRVKALEPLSYGGAHDIKELENLIFDMKQYFRVTQLKSKDSNMSLAIVYLIGDAKL